MAKTSNENAPEVGEPGERDEKTSDAKLVIDDSTGDRQAYPLKHELGYMPFPRDATRFEPLIKDPNAFRMYALLYSRAAPFAGWKRGSHGDVYVEEGQALGGIRDIADALGLAKNTAHRVLKKLEKLGLIHRKAGQRGSVISLVCYGLYGDAWNEGGTATGTAPATATGTQVGQHLRQRLPPKERINVKNEETKERENTLARVSVAEIAAVYQLYPKKTGKAKGLAKAKKKLGTREEFAKFKTAVATMGESWANHDTQFCPGFEAFVTGERWNDDELPKPSKGQSPTGTGYYEHTGTEIYGTGEIKI